MSGAADRAPTSLKVLVTGGRGFIGSHIVAALLQRGHRVRIVSRNAAPAIGAGGDLEWLALDLSRATRSESFTDALDDIDAVVNCAGILRETGNDRFKALHTDMPAALAEAAAARGIRRVVQISALGKPEDGDFIASKHEGDSRVAAALPEAVILRPSLVYSATASYGGTSLLRSLAALPLTPLPAGGNQQVQPVATADLASLVCSALEAEPRPRPQAFDVGGPKIVSLRQYLEVIRHWLGLGGLRALRVPRWLAATGAWLGQLSGRGPVGMTMWRMLQRGNVCDPDALDRLETDFGFTPQPLDTALASHPASSADRWHARLYVLAPLLRLTLALTWIASGIVGLMLDPATLDQLGAAAGLDAETTRLMGNATSLADIGLGTWLLLSRKPMIVLTAMLAFVLGYTAFIGILLPIHWLDPFGGLLKNGIIAVAIVFAMATAERS